MKKGTGIILTLIVALLIGIVGVGGYYIVNQEKKIDELSNGTNNTVTDEKNEDKNNKYDEANKAIKEALKDERWLENNDLTSYSMDEKVIDGTFIKINDIDGMPAYIIVKSYGDSFYERIVTYKDNNVYVSDAIGGEYMMPFVDVKENIIFLENPALCTYYKIVDCEFVIIDQFEDDGNMDENTKKYDKYDFKDIDTELTEENIDAQVK